MHVQATTSSAYSVQCCTYWLEYQLGNGDFTLYRIPSIGTPSIAIEGGTKRIYIGNGGEKGRQIWLGKMDPSTL